MQIQTFRNMKGLIYGSDPKRIECDTEGILRIGKTEITVTTDGDSIMPILFGGATGKYKATFTDKVGNIYDLDKVEVRNGRINPPRQIDVELMELRSRSDILERENEYLKERIEELSNIFDTNSLNFLIG